MDVPRLTPLAANRGTFRYRHRLFALGPVALTESTYRQDISAEFVEFAPMYRISLPVNGSIEYTSRAVEGVAHRGNAAISGPGDALTVKRWPGGTRLLSAKLDSGIVEAALASMIGGPVGGPIEFLPDMPTDVEPASSWMNLATNIGRVATLLENPLVAAPFADSLARGLLIAGRHSFSRRVVREATLPRSTVIRAAIGYIEDNVGVPMTVSQIASFCHISTRALQVGFKKHVGMSPITYARRARLRKAHAELQTADHDTTTVTSIAHRWGFTNLGRFAAEYRSAYGRSPAETLRLPR
ncbi:MAG TPA: AraC family transcriptional regulator [Umezawaea sp.]|nr:AraC family transcriptional regulator [Umezawaea sp.]